jgi:putative FmdB family regulatory protein
MPTYDYKCTQCYTQFEVLHSIHECSPKCPACGGTVKKLFLSPPAVHGYMAYGRELAMRSLRQEQKQEIPG